MVHFRSRPYLAIFSNVGSIIFHGRQDFVVGSIVLERKTLEEYYGWELYVFELPGWLDLPLVWAIYPDSFLSFVLCSKVNTYKEWKNPTFPYKIKIFSDFSDKSFPHPLDMLIQTFAINLSSLWLETQWILSVPSFSWLFAKSSEKVRTLPKLGLCRNNESCCFCVPIYTNPGCRIQLRLLRRSGSAWFIECQTLFQLLQEIQIEIIFQYSDLVTAMRRKVDSCTALLVLIFISWFLLSVLCIKLHDLF